MSLEEQWVIVRLGNILCGLNIQAIKEIVKLKHITPIPNTPDFVEGLMNQRGQIVCVINLVQRLAAIHTGPLHTIRNQASRTERVIVIQLGPEFVGLHVDGVDQVLTTKPEDIEPLCEGELSETGLVEGVVKVKDTLVHILNINILLRPLGEEVDVI